MILAAILIHELNADRSNASYKQVTFGGVFHFSFVVEIKKKR